MGGKLGQKKVRKSDAKKGLVLGGQGGGGLFPPLGQVGPALIRGRLGGISPLAFIGGLVFLSDIMVLKYGKPKTIQYNM